VDILGDGEQEDEVAEAHALLQIHQDGHNDAGAVVADPFPLLHYGLVNLEMIPKAHFHCCSCSYCCPGCHYL
jgi:hypothetical protein